ncbi:AAEL010255-PA [Aedes aegypti]|uniref:AAEL010255-PA n=1 Tax=Aedes aegypti TaxID=7159 RepID=Q16TG3_AEDAE|nr:AAEL010255-PA [Aedes aegypti]
MFCLIPTVFDVSRTCNRGLCHLLIISAIFMREIPLEVTGILPQLINSFSGGTPLVVTGIYSYLTIVTTESERTFRFACAAVVIAIIPILASFFSGYIFKALGFINLCLLCMATNSIGLLYGLFVLKEPTKVEPGTDADATHKTGNEPNSSTPAMKLFDITLVTDCVKVLTKKRGFNVRTILILTLVVFFINFGAAGDLESALNIAILKFNWISNLGTWVAYDLMTTLLGTLLAMGVLSKRLGVSDFLICVFSVCFTLIAKPIMAYAASSVQPYLYYVATSIDVFEGSKIVAIRSIVSKLVEQNEIGEVVFETLNNQDYTITLATKEDDKLRAKYLEADTSLEEMLKIGRTYESVKHQVQEFRSTLPHPIVPAEELNVVDRKRVQKLCGRCAGNHGENNRCPARDSHCNLCRMPGHYARCCRRSRKPMKHFDRKFKKPRDKPIDFNRRLKFVREVDDVTNNVEVREVFHLSGKRRVNGAVGGVNICFVVDTGADEDVLSEEDEEDRKC